MVKHHELNHPRKISSVEEGEIAIYGTSDGGLTWHPISVDDAGRLNVVTGLVPHGYDFIELSYTGSNLTGVEYKEGGASGTTVATLAITYDGSGNILTITKT